jgi:hypothetical protein
MGEDRDPLFIACFNGNHQGYKDDPEFTLIDEKGQLLLRTGEQILAQFGGNIMMLRYPEQRWLINPETTPDWTIIFTTERIAILKRVVFNGAFEFFDHIETFGKFAGLHPTDEIKIDEFFHWLGQKDKRLQKFTLCFQLAYSRISMVSCIKTTGTDVSGIDFWYDDAPNNSQSGFQLYPLGHSPKQIYDLGVQLNGAILKQKLQCLEKKHQLDPSWEMENYNSYLAATQRLVTAPDFLSMGSGTIESESYDPITFQPHSLVWNQ